MKTLKVWLVSEKAPPKNKPVLLFGRAYLPEIDYAIESIIDEGNPIEDQEAIDLYTKKGVHLSLGWLNRGWMRLTDSWAEITPEEE